MKKVALLVLAMAFCAWAVGCTTVIVKEEPKGPEVLLPGEFIEQTNAEITLVKCTGRGPDQRMAIDNARKGCLEWFIINQLSLSSEERQSYQANQQKLFAQLDRYVNLPPPGTSDGKGKGVKSQVRLSDTEIKVEIITDVHKKQLEEDLVAMGVTKKASEVAAAVGLPTMMVMPAKESKGNQFRGLVQDLIGSYLTKNKFDVANPENAEDLRKRTDAMAESGGAEEDEIAKIAQATGAEIYLAFKVKVDKKGDGVAYGVGIAAFETTSNRQLATEMVLGPARANWIAGQEAKAFAEPVNDAMGTIIPQVMSFWKDDIAAGNRILVTIKNFPRGSDTKIYSTLKKMCSMVKSKVTGKTVVFQTQCKADNMELAGGLEEVFGTLGGSFDFLAKEKNSLLVVFK